MPSLCFSNFKRQNEKWLILISTKRRVMRVEPQLSHRRRERCLPYARKIDNFKNWKPRSVPVFKPTVVPQKIPFKSKIADYYRVSINKLDF